MTRINFDVLGPLRVRCGDTTLGLGSVQQRVVLGVLLLRANRPVSRDQLIAAVWGGSAPAYAVNLVQKHVASLRRILEPDRPHRAPSRFLEHTDAGYRLIVTDDDLDLARFESTVAEARRAGAAGDVAVAAAGLRAASELWRGTLCEGLASPLIDSERHRLEDRRIGVLEERLELDLELGEHRDAVAELRVLVTEHPLRERSWGLLMLALYRSGRTAEALSAFHEARRRFIDELGLEPADPLRHLHEQILARDPSLGRPASTNPVDLTANGSGRRGPGAGPGIRIVPAQLPSPIPQFIGRRSELARLDALIDGDVPAPAVVITGPPGIGKTTLAAHWAHRVRHHFPDGQLHVNLLGFDPGHPPLPPAEAVRAMLEALGVPATMLPVTPAAQAAHYRSLLAGRRVLILIDSAHDAEQVRPLLPGAPGCLVIVTSRDQLPGLVAAQGAHPIRLGLLGAEESRELMRRRLGAERMTAEPLAVDDMVACCAGLPLALSIAATRAALYPEFPLATLADELRSARTSLDVFEHGDRETDVRAVFACSYRALDEPAATVLRLLSIHPGPTVGPAAAASLAGLPPRGAVAALAALARAHLIDEPAPARFRLHDLLRVYAGELTAELDDEPAVRAAWLRLVDHYVHTATEADRRLNPHQDPVDAGTPADGVTPQPLADAATALAWFTDEHQTLLTLVERTGADGLHRPGWLLARALTTYLHRRGHWSDVLAVQRVAVAAAGHLADRAGEAAAERSIATACLQLGRVTEAEPHLHRALTLYGDLGDAVGQARVRLNLAHVDERHGRHGVALDHARRALALFEQAGNRVGQADALNAIGWYHAHLGRHRAALTYCDRALALHRATGDREGEAHTSHSLAYAYQRHGDDISAIASYREALVLWRGLGDRYFESDTLVRIGDIHHRRGETGKARAAWEQAVAIFDTFGHADADHVRARLTALEPLQAAGGRRTTR